MPKTPSQKISSILTPVSGVRKEVDKTLGATDFRKENAT